MWVRDTDNTHRPQITDTFYCEQCECETQIRPRKQTQITHTDHRLGGSGGDSGGGSDSGSGSGRGNTNKNQTAGQAIYTFK